MFSGGDQTEARGAASTEFTVIWPQVSGSDDVLKGGRMNLEGCLQMTFLKLKSDVSLPTEIPTVVSRATMVGTSPSCHSLASPLFLLIPLP